MTPETNNQMPASPTPDSARILLVYPPSRLQGHGNCPASLTMLGAVLEHAGHQVYLLDANAAVRRYDRARIVERARELRPHVIGITLLTPIVREAYRLAEDLRGTGARLLAGGPHATLVPDEPLKYGFDAVVIGEGEPTIAEAIDGLLGRVPKDVVSGWVYRDADGTPRRTKPRPVPTDLDALPLPARHLVDPANYGGAGRKTLHQNLFSSRGCPARCSYCAGGLFGRRFRFRSPESLLQEIADVHRRFGTTHFHFMDDATTANRKRILELCEGLERIGFSLTWSMMTRVDFVDEEILAAARRAGCTQIDYGIESGDPDTLRRIHRPHTIEMVQHVIPLTASLGIRPYVFFILGFPWDTVESLERTQSLMAELAPCVDCFHPAIASVLIPFPGTEIYDDFKDQFAFNEWWLDDRRAYDAPDAKRHAYFQSHLFPRGAVLDADFFRYTAEVRRKIEDIFVFMLRHNLRRARPVTRILRPALIEASRRASRISPALERVLFWPVETVERRFKPGVVAAS